LDATFTGGGPIEGEVTVPGDKSISHRAAIIGALADGRTAIENYSPAADCASTLGVLRSLGAGIDSQTGTVIIEGRGGSRLKPGGALDCGNSGTTMRLMAGAVAPFETEVVLDGDGSLRRRPMGRIIVPLTLMGARINASDREGHPPLVLSGGGLTGIDYAPPVASAQVKSAVLLAGLGAKGPTTVEELAATRDHTERILERAGIRVSREGLAVTVEPGEPRPIEVRIPGDFSSAAFFIAAGVMCEGSSLRIEGVGTNPTRTGFLGIARRMGAHVEVTEAADAWEPTGSLAVRHSPLEAVEVSGEDVAEAIDEVTLVALLATAASGRTVIRGAGELRHKESDRIRGTVAGLRAMGARIEETADGMAIEGPVRLSGAEVDSRGDHRLAMLFAVAGLAASGTTVVHGWEWTDISYPGFAIELERLRGGR